MIIAVEFTKITYEEMKYSQTLNLLAGNNIITTPVTMEPYTVEFIDSEGNKISSGLGDPQLTLVGTTYQVTVYSTEALSNVKLKIIY